MKNQMINRLQDNLRLIRTLLNISCEALGEKIGLSKQSISNLELKNSPMTFCQYVTLRLVFDEISINNENFKYIIYMILDYDHDIQLVNNIIIKLKSEIFSSSFKTRRKSYELNKIIDSIFNSIIKPILTDDIIYAVDNINIYLPRYL